MTSQISCTPIQHWLNSPFGSYYGYPKYGNSFEQMLFENNNDTNLTLAVTMDDLIRDIGHAEASKIFGAEVAQVSDGDTVAIILTLKDGSLAGFKVIGDRT